MTQTRKAVTLMFHLLRKGWVNMHKYEDYLDLDKALLAFGVDFVVSKKGETITVHLIDRGLSKC